MFDPTYILSVYLKFNIDFASNAWAIFGKATQKQSKKKKKKKKKQGTKLYIRQSRCCFSKKFNKLLVSGALLKQ